MRRPTPGRNQSGDSDPDCRITKAGDQYLRTLLVQGAHYIMNQGPSCDLREHGHKLLKRGGKYARQKAAVAVARKLDHVGVVIVVPVVPAHHRLHFKV